MSYADAADLVARYDAREIGKLVSDDNHEVSLIDLASDPLVTAALDDASGDIEAALLVAKRYSVAELTSLTGNSLAKLKRLTCDIAMAYLMGRRPGRDPETLKAFEERAQGHLKLLRHGENVFNLADQQEAGLPDTGGPSTVDYDNLNLMRDRTKHYYPARRLPYNR